MILNLQTRMRSVIIFAFALVVVLAIAEFTPVNGEELNESLERRGGSKCKGRKCLEGNNKTKINIFISLYNKDQIKINFFCLKFLAAEAEERRRRGGSKSKCKGRRCLTEGNK